LSVMHILDLAGVVVFALTGTLAAGRKHMDLFGVLVLAEVTALGGGTLRDLMLNTPSVFWIAEPIYSVLAAATAVVFFFIVRYRDLPLRFLSIADALGLAVFTALGTEKALSLGTNWFIAIIMGVVTGVVGGIIRDILSGEIPLIFQKEIYATASFCGAIAFAAIYLLLNNIALAIVVSILITLGLRLAAITLKLSLPRYMSYADREKKE
jgi:uncharacterized membrane protein YeiH